MVAKVRAKAKGKKSKSTSFNAIATATATGYIAKLLAADLTHLCIGASLAAARCLLCPDYEYQVRRSMEYSILDRTPHATFGVQSTPVVLDLVLRQEVGCLGIRLAWHGRDAECWILGAGDGLRCMAEREVRAESRESSEWREREVRESHYGVWSTPRVLRMECVVCRCGCGCG